MNATNRKENGRTRDCVNPRYRFPHADNLRYEVTDGKPLATALEFIDGGPGCRAVKRISKDSVPLKIMPLACGSPSVRNVVFNDNETIVVFDNGDRVAVCCAKEDMFDRHSAVGWALLKYILGNNIGRRIDDIINKVGINASYERTFRKERRENERKAKAERITKSGRSIPING